MTDDKENLCQDEIEELLRQAAGSNPAATPAASSKSVVRPRSTVEIGPPPGTPPHSTASATAPRPGPMDEDVQLLLAQAEQAIRSVDQPVENEIPHLAPFELRDLTGSPATT